MLLYSAARQRREIINMSAVGRWISLFFSFPLTRGKGIHMACKVPSWLFSSGLKLGATTAKPTMTPRWTARATRSMGESVYDPSSRTLASWPGLAHTKNAVRHKANVVKRHGEPSKPQHPIKRSAKTKEVVVGRGNGREIANVAGNSGAAGDRLVLGKDGVAGGKEEVEKDLEHVCLLMLHPLTRSACFCSCRPRDAGSCEKDAARTL